MRKSTPDAGVPTEPIFVRISSDFKIVATPSVKPYRSTHRSPQRAGLPCRAIEAPRSQERFEFELAPLRCGWPAPVLPHPGNPLRKTDSFGHTRRARGVHYVGLIFITELGV